MREVIHDPRRKLMTDRAHELILRRYSEDSVGRTYRERIEAIRSELGAEMSVANKGAER